MEMYFLTWFLHNKNNNGWAYKVENKYTTLDAAVKAFHKFLSDHINDGTYDLATAVVTDGFGNVYKSEYWQAEAAPEPNE